MSYAAVVSAVAAVAGAAVSYQNGQEQKKSAEASMNQAKANALKAEKQADQDNNRLRSRVRHMRYVRCRIAGGQGWRRWDHADRFAGC